MAWMNLNILRIFFREATWDSGMSSMNWFNMTRAMKSLWKCSRTRGLDMSKCPFHYLGPVKPDMFVGRTNLINEILSGSQRAFAIAGGRRIGKSSLLLKLKDKAAKLETPEGREEYTSLYIDCSNFDILSKYNRRNPQTYSCPWLFRMEKQNSWFLTFKNIIERKRGISGNKFTSGFLTEIGFPVITKLWPKFHKLEDYGPYKFTSDGLTNIAGAN